MFVNRGVYHQGWTAATRHSVPWLVGTELPALDDDVWELYEPGDWTQANDVSAENPEKLHELQRLFLIEAVRCRSTIAGSSASNPTWPVARCWSRATRRSSTAA